LKEKKTMASKKKKRKTTEAPAVSPAESAPTPADPDLPGGTGLAVLAISFLAGAVLMTMEIVGGRIVASHFGSHVFVWGGLIGIFMGSLSLGYFLGGRVADRFPDVRVMGLVMALAGGGILLVPVVANPICRLVGSALFTGNVEMANRWNPTVAILLIFTLPSVLLGAISPFTVRLLAREIEKMGRITARVYASNAIGSIFGTVLTAFFLMSVMGNTAILVVSAILFLATGLAVAIGGTRLNPGANPPQSPSEPAPQGN